mmetsp:Transcript_17069/g.24486  ORF Transcript_17069/g.24486 Transcript_17069/m.24486 type:complete len:92 (-) Transcript_17069:108-383(-)
MKADGGLLRVVVFTMLAAACEMKAIFGYQDAENDLKVVFRLRSEDPFANDDVFRKLPNELIKRWDLEAPSTDAMGGTTPLYPRHVQHSRFT